MTEKQEISGVVVSADIYNFRVACKTNMLGDLHVGGLVGVQGHDPQNYDLIVGMVANITIPEDDLTQRIALSGNATPQIVADVQRNRSPMVADCIALGWVDGSGSTEHRVVHTLPQRPPMLLQSVLPVNTLQREKFTADPGYYGFLIRALGADLPYILALHIGWLAKVDRTRVIDHLVEVGRLLNHDPSMLIEVQNQVRSAINSNLVSFGENGQCVWG